MVGCGRWLYAKSSLAAADAVAVGVAGQAPRASGNCVSAKAAPPQRVPARLAKAGRAFLVARRHFSLRWLITNMSD